jgi:hypothetical protein
MTKYHTKHSDDNYKSKNLDLVYYFMPLIVRVISDMKLIFYHYKRGIKRIDTFV